MPILHYLGENRLRTIEVKARRCSWQALTTRPRLRGSTLRISVATLAHVNGLLLSLVMSRIIQTTPKSSPRYRPE
jgi:hypothetical protein